MLKVSALCLNNDREIKDCRVSWAKNVGNDKAYAPGYTTRPFQGRRITHMKCRCPQLVSCCTRAHAPILRTDTAQKLSPEKGF
jgi:hypothetical protein